MRCNFPIDNSTCLIVNKNSPFDESNESYDPFVRWNLLDSIGQPSEQRTGNGPHIFAQAFCPGARQHRHQNPVLVRYWLNFFHLVIHHVNFLCENQITNEPDEPANQRDPPSKTRGATQPANQLDWGPQVNCVNSSSPNSLSEFGAWAGGCRSQISKEAF